MSEPAFPDARLQDQVVPVMAGATDPGQPELALHPVQPRLRPGQVIATVIVVLLLVWISYGVAANSHFEWGKFGHWFTTSVIISGLWVTLEVTGWSALLGIVLGVLLAVARLSRNSLWRAVSWLYIWFFRSIPLVLLLLILYNLSYFYPRIGIGIPFGPTFGGGSTTHLLSSAMLMGVLGLGLNEAAYAAELVRGGILSVDHGQIEAANALGLSYGRQLRRVILPQALRVIIPGYVNQVIGLIKSSSLVYYVSLLDIFSQVFLLESRFPTDVVPLLLVGAAWYLILTAILSVVQYYLERLLARGAVRTLPPTPWQNLRASGRSAWALTGDLRTRIMQESAR
ncbi:MAG: amino acid ABC transporter permease [Trebonia sp.]